MGIEVDRGSIDEVVAKAANYEIDEFWMHFRTDNCTLNEFGDALQMANDADDEATYGEGGDRIPTGIVFIVVPRSEVDRFERWLSLLVSGLEDRGATGRLEVIESVHAGNWPTEDPTPAAFVACTEDPDAVMVDERRRTAWHVPTDATREIITSAAAWAEAGGTHTSVKFGIFPLGVSPESDVASMLHTSLVDNKASGCTCYQPDQQRGRRVAIRPRGKVVMQAIGAQVPWQQRIEAEYEALTTLPNRHLDLAFIRPATRTVQSWLSIDKPQKLPNLDESHIRNNRHLLSRHTPDAHGIQVLTDQHLDRARDLSSWTVREIGENRFLVEAKDLTTWYSTTLPDQDAVDQARHDFGDMILTQETIAANPPPWRN